MTPETIQSLVPVMLALIGLGSAVVAYLGAKLNSTVNKIAEAQKLNTTAIAANTVTANETRVKADTIIEKSDKIHELADGNLTQMRSDLKVMTAKFDVANERIQGLEKLVAQMTSSNQVAEKVADWVKKKPEDEKTGS